MQESVPSRRLWSPAVEGAALVAGEEVQEPVEFTTENASSLLLWVGLAVILLLLVVLFGVVIGRRRQVRY